MIRRIFHDLKSYWRASLLFGSFYMEANPGQQSELYFTGPRKGCRQLWAAGPEAVASQGLPAAQVLGQGTVALALVICFLMLRKVARSQAKPLFVFYSPQGTWQWPVMCLGIIQAKSPYAIKRACATVCIPVLLRNTPSQQYCSFFYFGFWSDFKTFFFLLIHTPFSV